MGNKLYVGNLAYSVRDESLQESFSQFGTVTSAKVMMDRDTGRSKGFGFVEMASDAEAQAAINGMNGQALEGRAIVVPTHQGKRGNPVLFASGFIDEMRHVEGDAGARAVLSAHADDVYEVEMQSAGILADADTPAAFAAIAAEFKS